MKFFPFCLVLHQLLTIRSENVTYNIENSTNSSPEFNQSQTTDSNAVELETTGKWSLHKLSMETKSHTIPENHEGDHPDQVYVGLFIESMGNLDETKMSFEMDTYVRMSWKNTKIFNTNLGKLHVRDKKTLDEIPVPDLYFPNAKWIKFQSIPVENSALYVDHNGLVAYSTRLNLDLSCQFDLKRYPMDTQICKIQIASYAHTIQHMNVSWFSKQPIKYKPEISLAEFQIVNILPRHCDGNSEYAVTEEGASFGEFACLKAEIHLERMLSCHLVHSYIPTGLIVVVSWVNFWIDRAAVPARITLLISTLLTFTTQGAGLRFGLPNVAYAKAIDLWYAICLLFLFGALVEFAVVNSLMRGATRYYDYANGGNKRRRKSLRRSYSDLVSLTNEKQRSPRVVFAEVGDSYSYRALSIDKLSRLCFPVIFLLFCSIYWFYFKIL